jgi:hypothetical protein
MLLKLLKCHQCFKYNIFNIHVFNQTFNYQILVYFLVIYKHFYFTFITNAL